MLLLLDEIVLGALLNLDFNQLGFRKICIIIAIVALLFLNWLDKDLTEKKKKKEEQGQERNNISTEPIRMAGFDVEDRMYCRRRKFIPACVQ